MSPLFLAFLTAAYLPGCSTRSHRSHSHRRLRGGQEPLGLLSSWEPWDDTQKMKVVYGVFTSPLPKYAQQMSAVADTWAKEVPPQKLLVVGVNGSTPGATYKEAPLCKDGHVNNAGISCKEATLLATGYKLGADWVVVVGSDNYVFPKNIEERLMREDAKTPQILAIFGCGSGQFCEDGKPGICGGGGYAISRAALDKMVGKAEGASETFVQESMHTARTVGGYWSDQVTSCIARRHGVKEVQLDGLYGWQICQAGNLVCNFNEASYREKIMSTSPKPLTFHYIEPDQMSTIHKMVKDAEAGVTVAAIDGAVHLNLLETAAVEDDYEAERAAYIQMVNKEVFAQHQNETDAAKLH